METSLLWTLTAATYWVLIVLWSGILVFYVKRLLKRPLHSRLFLILITILAIDAFRTMVESIYFGAWYTSKAGILPPEVDAILVQPQILILPKLLTVITGCLIVFILLRHWLPHEEHEQTEQHQQIERLTTSIAERKQTEQILRKERKFLIHTLKRHEQDRQLIAYDIHDGFIQDVTGAKMRLDGIRGNPDFPERLDASEFDAVATILSHAIDEARRLISGLRPPMLDEEGIAVAVEYMIDQQATTSDCRFEFQTVGLPQRLEPHLEVSVYRILQEAITNIVRHSQSPRAEIRIDTDGQEVRLLIRDWGIGFDPDQVEQHRFGLQGIRERVELLQGRFTLTSTPGEGTSLTVELPLTDASSLASDS